MKYSRLYEQVLRRLLREEPDFGEVVFSPYRSDDVSKEEPNTPEEDRILSAIQTWFSKQEPFSPEDMALVKDAMHGKYSDFFKAPTSGTLYRGMAAIPRAQLAKWLGMKTEDVPAKGSQDTSFVASRKQGMESWTTDLRIAKRFSKRDHEGYSQIVAPFEAAAMKDPKYVKLKNDYKTEMSKKNRDFVKLSKLGDVKDKYFKQIVAKMIEKGTVPVEYFDVILEADVSSNAGSLLDLQYMIDRLDMKKVWSYYKSQSEILAIGPLTVTRVNWQPIEMFERTMGIGTASFVKDESY